MGVEERAPACLDAAAEAWLAHYDDDEQRLAAVQRLAEFGVLSNRNLEVIIGLSWFMVAKVSTKRDHTGGRLAPHTLPLMIRLREDWASGIRNARLCRTIIAEGTSRGMVARLTGIPIKAVEKMS